MSNQLHISVFLKEILDFFQESHIENFIDGTLGAGGHAFALLEKHPEIKVFMGFDQDPYALNVAEKKLSPFSQKCRFIHANFSEMQDHAGILKEKIDGILLDLGVSSMQLDLAEKGFSFSKDGPLDMRMNPHQELSAMDVINDFSEEKLGEIFREYGEEKQWKKAAYTIKQAREKRKITTTKQLADILSPVLYKKGKINPLTLIFQGLRIYVNDEINVVKKVLPIAISLLRKGGKLAVITFHSLEDRIVKQVFKHEASDRIESPFLLKEPERKEPTIKILTKKPLEPSYAETKSNPRSRSAKLRVIEKL